MYILQNNDSSVHACSFLIRGSNASSRSLCVEFMELNMFGFVRRLQTFFVPINLQMVCQVFLETVAVKNVMWTSGNRLDTTPKFENLC